MSLLFLDIATSGFDPTADKLLELALMLVSSDAQLEVLEVAHHFVYHTEGDDLEVPDFHRKNGLLLECFDPCGEGLEKRKLEALLLAGPWSSAERIVGRGVDFDLKFLREHMPTFAAQLPTVRTLDVNELEYIATVVGRAKRLERGERTYRAEDDLGEAYEAFRYYTAPLRP